MIKSFKKIFLFMLLCSYGLLAFAEASGSRVMLTNNTQDTIYVSVYKSSTDSNFVREGSIKTIDKLVPYQSKSVLWMPRETHVKNGQVYTYRLQLSQKKYPGEDIIFEFRVTGHVIGSGIWQKMILPNKIPQVVLENKGFRHYQGDFWSGTHKIHFRRYQQGIDPFDDLHIVVDKPVSYGFSTKKNTELSILTYNVQLMPFYVGVVDKLNQTSVREKDLVPLIDKYDIVAFQELFDKSLRLKVIKDMHKHYPYHTKVVGDGTNLPLTGGVMIFSKWPIIKQRQMVYSKSHGVDSLAAKGVIYAAINKKGKHYHLFATHTVASDSARKSRLSELQQLRGFVEAENIPANEPVLLAGDFNINEFSDEFVDMLAETNTVAPPNVGYKYSSDGFVNLMATDIEKKRLDYVLYSKRYLQPKNSFNRVFVLRALYDESKWPLFDLSDHFPVEAYFSF